MSSSVVGACVAFIVMLAASRAVAQSNQVHDRAAEIKREGDIALSEKRYVDALDAYDRSYALEANTVLFYNRGRALQFLARYPESIEALERFRKDAPDDLRSRVPGLDNLITELHAKIADVSVQCDIIGARVLLNHRDVGAPRSQPFRVNAGSTLIEVLADGYFPFRAQLALEGHSTTPITARLVSRATFGLLVVRSTIEGTSVFVDAHRIGVSPAEAALSPGQHPVRVERDGYDATQTQIVLGAGERKELLLDPIKSKPITSKWWFWTGAVVLVAVVAVTVTAIAFSIERPAPTGNWAPGQLFF